MIYFCADDYGVSKFSNDRIEKCLESGVLNKISVLPNGEISGFVQRFKGKDVQLSLHLNLVEGYPISDKKDVNLLVSKSGTFKYSFIGLLFISLFGNRKKLKEQLYKEISAQIKCWKIFLGDHAKLFIDSHQHIHVIPLVFKTLVQVINDENVCLEYLRIPAEPLAPYLLTPSLYFSYNPIGIIKQLLLNILNIKNKKLIKSNKIKTAYFFGVLFSGKLTKDKINKLLPRYLKLAKNSGKHIEIAFHPGYLQKGECLIDGCRDDFKRFYFSPNRKKEYNTLIDFKC